MSAAIREAQALQDAMQHSMPVYDRASMSSSRQDGVPSAPGQDGRAKPPQGAIPRMAPQRQPAMVGPEVSAVGGDGLTGSSRRRSGWQGGRSSLQDLVGLQAPENIEHSMSGSLASSPIVAPSSPDQAGTLPVGDMQHVAAGTAPSARTGSTSARLRSIRLMTPDASAPGPALTSATQLGAALAEPGRQAAGGQDPGGAALVERASPPPAMREAWQRPVPRTGEEAEFSVGESSVGDPGAHIAWPATLPVNMSSCSMLRHILSPARRRNSSTAVCMYGCRCGAERGCEHARSQRGRWAEAARQPPDGGLPRILRAGGRRRRGG